LVRYQKFDILTLGIVSDIVVIAADDITPTQAEEPIMGIGVEDIHVEVSTEKSLTVEPLFKVTTQEIIIAPNHEAPVVTSEMRQPLTQLAPTLLGETSVSPSTSESVSIMIIETGSGSAPLVLTPAMDILEELSLQMVKQFCIR